MCCTPLLAAVRTVRKPREGRTAPDAGRLLMADLLIMASGIVSQVILTQIFSQSEYGRWVIAIDLLRTLFLLAELGQPSFLLREIPRNLNRTNFFILRSGGMQIAATLALLIPAIALITYTVAPSSSTSEWYVITPLFVLAVGIAVLGYNPKVTLRAVGRADLEGYVRILSPLMFMTTLFVIQSFESPRFVHVVLGYLMANSISFFISLILILPYMSPPPSQNIDQVSDYNMLRLFREGLPYLVATALTPLAFRMDKFILAAAYTGGFTSVAVYNIAQMVFIASLAAPLAIRGGMTPIFSRMHDDTDSAINEIETTLRSIIFLLPIGLIIGTGLIVSLLPHLFSMEYITPIDGGVGALTVCMILLPGWIFAMLSAPAIAFIQAQKEAWKLTILFGIAVAVNSIIGLLLIPTIGLVGAAISTVIMHLSLVVVSWSMVERKFGNEFSRPTSILPASLTAILLIIIGVLNTYQKAWSSYFPVAWFIILVCGAFISGWRPKIPEQLRELLFSPSKSDFEVGDDE